MMGSSRKVVLLGVDGMDFELTSQLLGSLPHLGRLAQGGCLTGFSSVFPPDSVPAWITAYTGLDPSNHGILEAIDYLSPKKDSGQVDTSVFQGRTFWDLIGNAGQKVCVINPFMAYPVWGLNGVMINGPVFVGGEVQVSDPSWTNGLEVPKRLGGITDFPNRDELKEFVSQIFRDTEEQAAFGLEMLRRTEPGLFFQTFLTMDRLQHFLWRYCDPGDPTYPGPNEHENAIRDFYKLIDAVIGRFAAELRPGDVLLVVSDHGHGQRCNHCLNLNEILRTRNLLSLCGEGKMLNKARLVEKLKNRVLAFMRQHDLEDYIGVVARYVPNAKALKKGKHIVDQEKSLAYTSDFAGTNPFGGICVKKGPDVDSAELCRRVIDALGEIVHDGKPLVRWAVPREELFAGERRDRYPDVLFELEPDYGVNWAVETPLVTLNPTHKKISGGHKRQGVLLGWGRDFEVETANAEIGNLFPTLLSIFDVLAPSDVAGRPFLRPRNADPIGQ